MRWIVNLSLYLVLITFKMPPTLFIRIANTLLAFDMLPYLWKLTRFIGDWNYKLLKIDVYLWLIRSILCIIDVEREWARGSQCQVGKDDNLKRKQMKRWQPEKKTNEKMKTWKENKWDILYSKTETFLIEILVPVKMMKGYFQ